MTQLKIEYRRTDELVPYAKNARTHSDVQVNQLAESIKEFGFTNPVLIDHHGGIIAGHGRVMAAKVLGIDLVPTIMLGHLSDRQKQAYILADNKIALNSGWDFQMLAEELSELAETDYDLELTGFKEYPMEIAEVASMTMELFTMDYWDTFFADPKDLTRAKEHQLERVITLFPWIAIIDKFQHWIYENPDHTVEERTSQIGRAHV